MMENVQKIKIKSENIWIDLIRSIYAPYNDKKDSVNCLTQKSVGLKKNLNKYTHSDIPQL